jgi:hypothetical protein
VSEYYRPLGGDAALASPERLREGKEAAEGFSSPRKNPTGEMSRFGRTEGFLSRTTHPEKCHKQLLYYIRYTRFIFFSVSALNNLLFYII